MVSIWLSMLFLWQESITTCDSSLVLHCIGIVCPYSRTAWCIQQLFSAECAIGTLTIGISFALRVWHPKVVAKNELSKTREAPGFDFPEMIDD